MSELTKEQQSKTAEATDFNAYNEQLNRWSLADIRLSKSSLTMIVGFTFLGGWLWMDAQNGFVLRDQILPCALIIGCLIFMRAMDLSQEEDQQRPS